MHVTPARAWMIIDAFAEMVNGTDEDFEMSEYPEETRKQHQEAAKLVLDQWLDTVDATPKARAYCHEQIRWLTPVA